MAEATLQRSQHRFQQFFQDAPLPLLIAGLDGMFQEINTRFIQVFGYTAADLPDVKTWGKLAYPDAAYRTWVTHSWNASLARADQHGADIEPAEYRITCKDGSVRIMTVTGIILGNDILITFFDNTEQRQSEERFKLAMDATQDGMWDIDLQTQKAFVTPRFYEIAGYPPGAANTDVEFLRQTVHPDDLAAVRELNLSHAQGDTTVSAFEFRIVTASKEVKWVQGRAKNVGWDANGKPARIVGVITDIGMRKQAEQALRESESFVRSVLDSVAAHIAVIDRKGFIVAVNAPWQAFAEQNSYIANQDASRTGIGVNYLNACNGDPSDPQSGHQARIGIQAVLDGQLPSYSQEYPCHSPDEQRWFSMYVTPLVDVNRGAVVVHTNITEHKQAEIERKRANALADRLSVFVSAATNYALIMLGHDGMIVDWSQGAESLTGLSRKRALGRDFASLFTAGRRVSGWPQELLSKARAKGHVAVEERIVRADQTDFVGSGTLYCLPESAEAAQFAVILSDVTAAQQAALQVAESEARLSAIIGAASDAIVSTDDRGIVKLFNPAAERIFQVAAEQMLGKTLDRLIPDMAQGAHQAHMQDFSRSGVTRRAMGAGKVEALRADGQRIELEASISKTMVTGEVVLTAILRDITDRTRAERALVQYQVQLAGLAHRLLAQEKETTQKLAQALHDDLGQTLAALRLIFEADRKRMETEVAQPLWTQRMERLIIEANKQARKVLTDLRPPQLDEHGLLAALDNELQQRQKNHDQIAFRLDGATLQHGIRWPGEVEYAAFMVAREAINNALLHAAPASVVVHVSGDARSLLLSIADDGKGIADLASLERVGHLGVIGMRERATAIGAKLDVKSAAETGTRVSLQWGHAS